MKKYIATTIAATGLIVLIFGMECNAQSARRLTVDIPFDFYVGEGKMPSGKYEFEQTMQQTGSGGLIVRSAAKSARPAIIVPSAGRSSKGMSDALLVFNRYGSEHFLAQVNLGADDLSFRIRKSAVEKRVAAGYQVPVPVPIRQAVAARR
jgi:hypothetical protein